MEGVAKRLRPKFMTMATTFVGFIPILWATGAGSEVWKRIAGGRAEPQPTALAALPSGGGA